MLHSRSCDPQVLTARHGQARCIQAGILSMLVQTCKGNHLVCEALQSSAYNV